VEVDDHDAGLRARAVDELVDDLPRRDGDVHEERTEQVDDGDLDTVVRPDDGEPAAGRLGAGVGRADDALARSEVGADPVAAERMVAERDDVRAGGEKAVRELARDAGAVGDVLAVDDADVDAELGAQRRQSPFDGLAAGDAEDVCEEEDPQFRTTAADVRTSTVTWLPASFV
jgi:hypothetical protein